MNAGSTIWTPKVEELLLVLWDRGESASQISDKLKNTFSVSISRNAVIGKVHRLRGKGELRAKPTNPDAIKKRVSKKTLPPAQVKAVLQPKSFEAPQASIPDRVSLPGIRQEPSIPKTVNKKPEGQIGLMELERHHCRYPTVHTSNGVTFFCGEEKLDGSSYCPEHHSMCCIGFAKPSKIKPMPWLPRLGGFGA